MGEKMGVKKICGRPTGHNFNHPLDRKHIFFKGGLIYVITLVNSCLAFVEPHFLVLSRSSRIRHSHCVLRIHQNDEKVDGIELVK